jgi:O-antigen/teichoic acid export membrane protein
MKVNELKTGAILSYVVLAVNSIVGLVYTPYMLRMMGQSEFGLYSLVSSVIAYLAIFDLGFGNAIIRYTAKFRAEGKYDQQYCMFGMFIVLYSIIGIIVFILGLYLYFNIDVLFGDTMSVSELNTASVLVLLMVFNLSITFPLSIFGAIISGYEDFVFQKIVQILRIILNTIVMVAILETGYKAIGMVVVITGFNVLTLLINWWYCISSIKIKLYFHDFDFVFLKEIVVYSFFIFLNVVMDKIYWSTGQFMLGAYVGTAAVAVFAVAIQLQQMYMSFSTAISGVFLPRVTAMTTNIQSEKAISDLFIRTGRLQYIVMAFILTSFLLFGKQFVLLWAGKEYDDVYTISLIFFIPLTIPLIQNLGITILQARNQMKFRSILYIILAIFSLSLQIPLVKMYGAIGAAVGVASALVLGQIIIMNIYYFKKQNLDIPKFWCEILKMSIIPAILGFIFYLVLQQFKLDTISGLVFSIVSFTLVYTPIFWCLSMNNYERELFSVPVLKFIKNFKSRPKL